jgi:2-polyprenyl-3-methyl-5-hydroxy-6-metoxy-1,4-benzoquinol methylase
MNAELRQALILEAAAVHEDPTKWPGETLKDYIKDIQSLIEDRKPSSILDYGCGKAILHQENAEVKSWKCDLYDPAYTPFAEYPTRSYDMIICTDVLEHIPTRKRDRRNCKYFKIAKRWRSCILFNMLQTCTLEITVRNKCS